MPDGPAVWRAEYGNDFGAVNLSWNHGNIASNSINDGTWDCHDTSRLPMGPYSMTTNIDPSLLQAPAAQANAFPFLPSISHANPAIIQCYQKREYKFGEIPARPRS